MVGVDSAGLQSPTPSGGRRTPKAASVARHLHRLPGAGIWPGVALPGMRRRAEVLVLVSPAILARRPLPRGRRGFLATYEIGVSRSLAAAKPQSPCPQAQRPMLAPSSSERSRASAGRSTGPPDL